MNENQIKLRPGISEAVKAFWEHIGRRTPLAIPMDEFARGYVQEALLLALGKLYLVRDKEEKK